MCKAVVSVSVPCTFVVSVCQSTSEAAITFRNPLDPRQSCTLVIPGRTGEAESQDHPWLHSESKASLVELLKRGTDGQQMTPREFRMFRPHQQKKKKKKRKRKERKEVT